LELTREHPGDKVFVRAVDAHGITVAEETYGTPLVLSPDSVNTGWTVKRIEDITEASLQTIFELDPEVVIVGTGRKQHFLDPAILMLFHQAGIGIEVMDTRAACRTFNILVMEERKVVAALMPLDFA
jgi:uncharacterized protein